MAPEIRHLHIRPGMDVYDAYQETYIGSVVHVWHGDGNESTSTERGATGRQTGAAPESAENSPHLTHEEGQSVDPTGHREGKTLGESMGPVPTMSVGNSGPTLQSAEHHYATDREDDLAILHYFAVRPGRINLGILTRPYYVPGAAVQSVSMERVVLNLEGNRLPAAWRKRSTLLT